MLSTVVLDGTKLLDDISKTGITQTKFAAFIGISPQTMSNAVNGRPVSYNVEEKITNALFKDPGYYRVEKKETVAKEDKGTAVDLTGITGALEDHKKLLDEVVDYMDELKNSNEAILKQLKSIAVLQGRLLALWEGEIHDAKSKDSKVSA